MLKWRDTFGWEEAERQEGWGDPAAVDGENVLKARLAGERRRTSLDGFAWQSTGGPLSFGGARAWRRPASMS